MEAQLKRLATSGLAYQAASLLAAFLALFTLPLYTRHLTEAEFGYAETLLTLVILTSILLRFGMGEAFVRLLVRRRPRGSRAGAWRGPRPASC